MQTTSITVTQDDGAITATYRPDGTLESVTHTNPQGLTHRVDGPAYIAYDKDGNITATEWRFEGQLHRIDGPALQTFTPDGQVTSEGWYRIGMPHRLDGPALTYTVGGQTCTEYWMDGRQVTPEYLQDLLTTPIPA